MSNRSQAIDHYNLGCDLSNQNCLEDALKEFEEAIELDASLAVAYVNSSDCLKRLKKFEQATYYCIKAIELDCESTLAHVNYADILFCMHRYHDAISEYDIILRTEPNNYDAVWGLSQCHAILGVFLKSIQFAIKGVFLRPFALFSYIQCVQILGILLCNLLIGLRKR